MKTESKPPPVVERGPPCAEFKSRDLDMLHKGHAGVTFLFLLLRLS